MKTILTLLLLIVVTTSCQLKKSDNTETAVAESTEIDNAEDCTADTVKATAIFWIDKAETKHCKEYGFRTIKAHVLIREDGKVDLMSFVKKQSPAVETYAIIFPNLKCRKRCLKAGMCNPENNSCSFAAYGEC